MAAAEAQNKSENAVKAETEGASGVHVFKGQMGPPARGGAANRRGGPGGRGAGRGNSTVGRGGGGNRGGRGGANGGGGPPFANRNAGGPRSEPKPLVHDNKAPSEISIGSSRGDPNRRPPHIEHDFVKRLRKIEGPTTNLGSVDTTEKEFNNKCRLYVGNLTAGATEADIRALFEPFGKIGELFVNNEKNYGFVRLDTRANAEKARNELDGFVTKGRPLRVRFSNTNSGIRVRNLHPFVTNELLEWGFQVFGEIERAVVICDERGKSTGEGIVEYTKKPSALFAARKCNEGAYFLSRSLRPVIVEDYQQTDEAEGYPERNLFKNSNEFHEERSVGPWFAEPGSFEAQYSDMWKEHFAVYKAKFEALEKEQKIDQAKLIAKMDYARYEHETERLRQQLLERENQREKQKKECELLEKRADDQKRQFEENFRRQEEERMHFQFRRQDNFRRDDMAIGGEFRGNSGGGNDVINPINHLVEALMDRRDFRGNGHMGVSEPQPLMDGAFHGGRDGRDNRTRWSAPRGDRRIPMAHDDAPHMKRRRF